MPDKYRSKAREAAAADRARRACGRKRPYASMEEALDRIPPNQEPYHCARCQQWHRATKRVEKLIRQMRSTSRRRS